MLRKGILIFFCENVNCDQSSRLFPSVKKKELLIVMQKISHKFYEEL